MAAGRCARRAHGLWGGGVGDEAWRKTPQLCGEGVAAELVSAAVGAQRVWAVARVDDGSSRGLRALVSFDLDGELLDIRRVELPVLGSSLTTVALTQDKVFVASAHPSVRGALHRVE